MGDRLPSSLGARVCAGAAWQHYVRDPRKVYAECSVLQKTRTFLVIGLSTLLLGYRVAGRPRSTASGVQMQRGRSFRMSFGI